MAKDFHRFFMAMAVRAYSYHVSLPCNENSSAVTLAGIGGVGTACFFSRELPKEISEKTVQIWPLLAKVALKIQDQDP